MAQVRVVLPFGVAYPEPQHELACEATSVDAALAAVLAAEPRLAPRIFADGKLIVGVFVNDRDARTLGGPSTPLADGDVVRLLPPVAGG
jgi:molybdopterin converting factor small subunit